MPRKIIIYQCIFCKTRYDTEEDVEKCEKNHKEPIGIHYFYNEGNVVPNTIELTFPNHQAVLYTLDTSSLPPAHIQRPQPSSPFIDMRT